MQRNPIIAAPHGEEYLVLDGAHRVRALRELDSRLVLAQLVQLPALAESWGHLLDAATPMKLREVEGADLTEETPCGAWLAEVRLAGGARLFVRARQKGLMPEVRALWKLREVYPKGAVVRRVDPDGPVGMTSGRTMIRYRPFTPAELIRVVRSGSVLPPGITRFRIPERVLGVCFPLDAMRNGEPATRNAELDRFVKERWEKDRVRYYGEPVLLFE